MSTFNPDEFTRQTANELSKEAELQELIQYIENAANDKRYFCEVGSLTDHQKQWLESKQFDVVSVEMMGGAKIQISWK